LSGAAKRGGGKKCYTNGDEKKKNKNKGPPLHSSREQPATTHTFKHRSWKNKRERSHDQLMMDHNTCKTTATAMPIEFSV
jgi:hypothetical protein